MSIWVEHENCGCGVEGAGTKYSHFKIRRCGSHAKTVDVSAILAKARAEERERWESALKRATAKAGTEVGCDSWRQGFRDGCAHVEIEFHKIRALVRGNKGEGELDEES
jgi:hypothetical protein